MFFFPWQRLLHDIIRAPGLCALSSPGIGLLFSQDKILCLSDPRAGSCWDYELPSTEPGGADCLFFHLKTNLIQPRWHESTVRTNRTPCSVSTHPTPPLQHSHCSDPPLLQPSHCPGPHHCSCSSPFQVTYLFLLRGQSIPILGLPPSYVALIG